MANHASAVKRNRQRIVRTDRNRAARSELRTMLKKARVALGGGDVAAAKPLIADAAKALARAAAKGVVHSNQAQRKTSRLTSQLAKLSQPG